MKVKLSKVIHEMHFNIKQVQPFVLKLKTSNNNEISLKPVNFICI